MQRFPLYLVFCFVCMGAGYAAYLPVVDVSRGDISARAAFGEEIVQKNKTVSVAPISQSSNKKVVARAASKAVANNSSVDVLKPNRPRSDLWAKNTETPLRMPRMDEITVLSSDNLLPEESLNAKPVKIARSAEPRVSQNEALNEIKKLRAEIAKLSAAQRETESKIARARPVAVRTPITGDSDVKSADEKRGVSVRREFVPMETEREIARRDTIKKLEEPKLSSVNEMSKMSPNELKKAFKKTYISENKHLSTYENVDNRFDTISDMSSSIEGFSATRDLSEMDKGVRTLEVKISFLNGDSGLSRENYTLLSETASIVVNNPKRAVQIAIPESATRDKDARKLASRRLAIVEQVLRDTGIAEQRIVPVLSQRDDDVFVLRIISGDTFESLTQQKRNMFGDTVSKKTYKSMSW